jgi:hypothetical protein
MRPLPTGTAACGCSTPKVNSAAKSYGKFCLARHLLPGTLGHSPIKSLLFYWAFCRGTGLAHLIAVKV